MARRAHLAVLICLAIIIASPIWPMAVAHATDITHPNRHPRKGLKGHFTR